MSQKIADRLTKVTSQQFITALNVVWKTQFSNYPTKQSLCVITAQSALETGWWKYCHNYNFGNAKAAPGEGWDYSYFTCGEDLPAMVADKLVAESTPGAPCKIVGSSLTSVVEVMFYPDHPGCCFRAFEVKNNDGTINEEASLQLGMSNYISLLYKRFSKSWPAVLLGDPRLFVQDLKAQGYFTAPEKPYENSVAEIFDSLMKTTTI